MGSIPFCPLLKKEFRLAGVIINIVMILSGMADFLNSERKKDLEKEKDGMMRQILKTQAEHARWLPQKEDFRSGDTMGFDLPDVSVRTVVTYDQYGVSVHMISPVDCDASKYVYHRQQTFFCRNPRNASLTVDGTKDGPANALCLATARDLVIGLYSDWAIIRSQKEIIRRKLQGLPAFAASFKEREEIRVAAVKKKIRELSVISGAIKRRFKAGELTQKEYIAEKKPYRAEIAELTHQAEMRDPFAERFREELSSCKFVKNWWKLIESMNS